MAETLSILNIKEFIQEYITNINNRVSLLLTKIDLYPEKELSRHIDRELLNELNQFSEDYVTYSIILYDLFYIQKLDKFFENFITKIDALSTKLDEVLTNLIDLDSKKSVGRIKNQLDFSFINETMLFVRWGIQKYKEKIEILEGIINNKQIEKFGDDLAKLYDQKKESLEAIETKFGQKVLDQDIRNLKDFYAARKKDKNIELKNYSFAFYISFGLLASTVIYLLLDLICFKLLFKDLTTITTTNNIIIYLLIITIVGLISFIMTDFRKRLNITKSILDDIDQKEVIVDSYSVLMEKRKNISDPNKERYEIELTSSIFGNLLSIKNYGYSHKDMQNMSPNLFLEAIEKILQRQEKK